MSTKSIATFYELVKNSGKNNQNNQQSRSTESPSFSIDYGDQNALVSRDVVCSSSVPLELPIAQGRCFLCFLCFF